jgi:hypothetical protein
MPKRPSAADDGARGHGKSAARDEERQDRHQRADGEEHERGERRFPGRAAELRGVDAQLFTGQGIDGAVSLSEQVLARAGRDWAGATPCRGAARALECRPRFRDPARRAHRLEHLERLLDEGPAGRIVFDEKPAVGEERLRQLGT